MFFGGFQSESSKKPLGFLLGFFDDAFRLAGIRSLLWKKPSVGLTKFQLPDDMCSDNQGTQAVLSGFHHVM